MTVLSAGPERGQLNIRQWITILVIALLLPMNALIVAAIIYFASLSKASQYSQLQVAASAIASSLESHFEQYRAIGQALSASPSIFENDLSTFRVQASAAFPELSEDWLLVSGLDGQEIMNLLPLKSLPHRDPDSIEAQNQAFANRSPLIAGVFRSADRSDWVATVEFPIFRDGKPYRELAIEMSAKDFYRLLGSQHLPGGWSAAIADTHGHFVAGSPGDTRVTGQPVSNGWQTTLHHPGIEVFSSPEGERIAGANEVSPLSGWTVGVAAKESVLDEPGWTTMRVALPAGIAVSLFSLILALGVARRISGPIRNLECRASALVRGEAVLPANGLPEVERIWEALQIAVQERQQMQQNLWLSEDMLRRAAEGALFGAHDYDVVRRRLRWSPELKWLLGLDPSEGLEVTPETAISFIHPEDRKKVEAAFEDAVVRQVPSYEFEFRALRGDGEVRWVLDRGQTIKDPDSGQVVRMTGILIDITERKLAELRLAAQLAEMDGLYRTAPIGLAVLRQDARFVRVNEALAAMTGKQPEELIDRPVWDVLPNVRATVEPILGRVIAGGETAAAELKVEAGGKSCRQWITKFYPVRDALGYPLAGVTVEDVTSRNAAARRQQMLIRELNHRVKNTLAIVQSIAMQTLRTAKAPDGFAEVFSARLASLARAHDLLTQSAWKGASLPRIATEAMAPFLADVDQDAFELTGPSVDISPDSTITLALMFHELASNAAKYGALSRPHGRIAIAWKVQEIPDGKEIDLHWKERGGPPVEKPAQQGFGTRLFNMGAEQLGGQIVIDYEPDGLSCHLRFPLMIAPHICKP